MFHNIRSKLVALVMLVAGIAFLAGGIGEYRVAGQLKEAGVNVPGDITGGGVKRGQRGSKTYTIEAAYEANGGHHSKSFKVPKALYESADAGAPIEVRYLPSDPKVAQIVGAEESGIFPMGFGCVVIVIGGFVSYQVFFAKPTQPVADPQPNAVPDPFKS
jgi:hypothetical protein